jgi:hypothetical protein
MERIDRSETSLEATEVPRLREIQPSLIVSLIPIKFLSHQIAAVAEGCAPDPDACAKFFAEG